MRSTRPATLAAVVVLLAVLTACGGGGDSAKAAGTSSDATSNASPASTSSASDASGANLAVDLAFTGQSAFTAKGSQGKCRIPGDGSYDFEISEQQYPGVGQFFSIDRDSAPGAYAFVKWSVSDTNGFSSDFRATMTFSPDLKTLQVDADLTNALGPEHVSGTIHCP